jgi:hypothetical protein
MKLSITSGTERGKEKRGKEKRGEGRTKNKWAKCKFLQLKVKSRDMSCFCPQTVQTGFLFTVIAAGAWSWDSPPSSVEVRTVDLYLHPRHTPSCRANRQFYACANWWRIFCAGTTEFLMREPAYSLYNFVCWFVLKCLINCTLYSIDCYDVCRREERGSCDLFKGFSRCYWRKPRMFVSWPFSERITASNHVRSRHWVFSDIK